MKVRALSSAMAAALFAVLWGSLPAAQQSGAPSLAPQEKNGEMLFFQRCSICHLPPLVGPSDSGRLPFGPLLYGFMDNARNESRVRQVIRLGGAQMPGFQYGLQPTEIEDIVAYMKSAPMKTPPEWFAQAQKRAPRGRGQLPVD